MNLTPKQMIGAGIAALLGFLAYREIFTKEGSRRLHHIENTNGAFAIYTVTGKYVRCEDKDSNIIADSECAGTPIPDELGF